MSGVNGHNYHPPKYPTWGAALREIRMAAGLSYADLADKCKHSKRDIRRWEDEDEEPPDNGTVRIVEKVLPRMIPHHHLADEARAAATAVVEETPSDKLVVRASYAIPSSRQAAADAAAPPPQPPEEELTPVLTDEYAETIEDIESTGFEATPALVAVLTAPTAPAGPTPSEPTEDPHMPKVFGRALAYARKKAGLTADDCGSLVGVSGSMIYQYELARSKPTTQVYEKLRDLFPGLPAPKGMLSRENQVRSTRTVDKRKLARLRARTRAAAEPPSPAPKVIAKPSTPARPTPPPKPVARPVISETLADTATRWGQVLVWQEVAKARVAFHQAELEKSKLELQRVDKEIETLRPKIAEVARREAERR